MPRWSSVSPPVMLAICPCLLHVPIFSRAYYADRPFEETTLEVPLGYLIRDAQRVSPQDEPFIVEFLIDDPISLPHHNVFIKNLGLLGIEVNAKPLVWKFSNDFKHSH